MSICPQCQNSKFIVLLFSGLNADEPGSNRLPILQCKSCLLVFTDPQSIPQNEELYFEGYYGEKKKESLANKIAIGFFQKERQLTSLPRDQESYAIPIRVLDVGCGDGTYLQHLPPEIQRFGFEPSAAGQKSLADLKIPFFDIYKESTSADAQFDLITMWQSLEHIEKPEEALRSLAPHLKNDGTLFVSVPNFSSLQRIIFGPRWFHLDPTRHLYHYTLTTLTHVLERNGYKVYSQSTLSLEYGVFGWWQSFFNLLPLDFNMGFKILKARKKYEMNSKTKAALLIYAFLAVPFGMIGLVLTLLEASFGRGCVISLKAKRA